ncbi:MAG: signal peptidase I [Bacteroidales bacterium]|nr:signal peptidase I [Bacteroidales bacterium]
MIISVLLLGVFSRLFFFEIFTIPSASMDNTMKVGDKIIVSKLQYGPRLPRSGFEIPWLNLFWYLNNNARLDLGKNEWGNKRLSGYSKINRGDIVVFNNPGNMFEFYIKRCVGLAGDSLQITNSKLYINKKIQILPEKAKSEYKIYCPDQTLVLKQLDSLNIYVTNFFIQKQKVKYLLCNISKRKKNIIESLSTVDSIIISIKGIEYHQGIFPKDSSYKWTQDNFGILWIPKKGSKIKLNDRNYVFYADIINKFENSTIIKTDNGFFIGNKRIKNYRFKQNYYFMMGDNRHQSMDSRYWGFVPESQIVGKAVLVLFSNDHDGIKWNRILKSVN